ncbi:MAG TPA: hypothetical protein VFN96_01765, partial [Gemmatimonadales bacterium]|nr:hypothetical protein [Gemmatimonadales bacterium]
MRVANLVRSALLVALPSFIGCADEPTAPTGMEPSPGAAAATVLTFRTISAGGFHSCGVTTDDRAYCWGYNQFGQLGDGTNVNRMVPTRVAGGLAFRQVSAGSHHTCGVTTGD